MTAIFDAFGSTFVVNQLTSGTQLSGAPARLADGTFVSLYTSADVTGQGTVIRMARFAPDGNRIGTDQIVSTVGADSSDAAIARLLSDGRVFVGWVDVTSGQVLAKIFNFDLSTSVSQFVVSQSSSSDSANGLLNAVSTVSSGTGPIAVSWTTTTATGDGGTSRAVHMRVMNLDGTAASSEITINSTTANDQVRPRAALLGNGNLFVTFTSQDGPSPSDQNIRGQIFTTAGVPVGSEFMVASVTTGDQFRNVVATLSDGRVIVAWESSGASTLGDSAGNGIVYRIFDSTGAALGTDQLANTTTASNQRFPAVSQLPDGRIVFAWESFGESTAPAGSVSVTFRARVMNTDGTWDGNDQALSTVTVPTNTTPAFSFAYVGNGIGYLVWGSGSSPATSDDGNGSGVQGQLFTLLGASDTAQYGTSVAESLTAVGTGANWINGGDGNDTLTGSGATNVLLGGLGDDTINAAAGASNFMEGGKGNDTLVGSTGTDTAWFGGARGHYQVVNLGNNTVRITDTRAGSPQGTDTVSNVELFQFADGTVSFSTLTTGSPTQSFVAFGPSAVANQLTSGNQSAGPTVSLPDGSVVQVYTSADLAGQGTAIRISRFAPDGTRIGGDLLVSTPGSDNNEFPTVAVLPGFKVMVTWIDSTTGQVLGRVYDENLNNYASQFVVNQTSSTDNANAITNIVPTSSGPGPVMVSWTTTAATGDVGGTSRAVHLRLMNTDGTAASSEIQVNTTTAGDQARPRAALLGNGNVVVVYVSQDGSGTSDQNLRAQIFSSSGVPVGSEFLVNSITTADQFRPNVLALADGRTLVTWESGAAPGDSSGQGIAYRFLDATGTPIGTDQLVNTRTTSSQLFAPAVQLGDGRIVFGWESLESSGNVIFRARVMNTDGTWDGNDQTLMSRTLPSGGGVPTFQMRPMGNNQLYLTWSAPTSGGGSDDGSGNGIESQMFVLASPTDLVLYGAGSNDSFAGLSSTANYINGSDGNDTLIGGSGVNVIYGGAGDDLITAGAGTNFLYGGTGNDTFKVAPTASLTGAIVGGQTSGVLAPGEINTLELNPSNLAGPLTFDLRTMAMSGITKILDDTTSGTVNLIAYGSQLDITEIAKSTGTLTFTVVADDTHQVSLFDAAGTTVTGFGSSDQIIFDASAQTIATTFHATPVATTMKGGSAGDTMFTGFANDTMIGGGGTDLAVFSGASTDYLITDPGTGTITVKDLRPGSPDGTDTLTGVEQLQFSNGTFSPAQLTVPARAFTALGSSFVVNQFTSGNQTNDQALRLADGTIVNLYTSADQAGQGTVIRMAHFGPDGTRLGTDALVSPVGSDSYDAAALRSLPDGKIFVSYVDVTSGQVLGKVYNADLSLAVSQFVISQSSSADNQNGVINLESTVTSGSGPVVVSWTTTAATGDTGGTSRATHFRLMNEDGTAYSSEIQVNTTTAGDQVRPRAVLLGNGNVLITFTSQDGSGTSNQNIRGQVFTPAGVAVGSEFVVNSITSADQFRQFATSLSDGRALVVWESFSAPGDSAGSGIVYRFLDNTGTPTGSDLLVNTTTGGSQKFSQVAQLADGRILFAWESFETTGTVTFRARVMNADGTWDGNDQALMTRTIAASTTNVPAFQLRGFGNAEYYLTWSSTNTSSANDSDDGSGTGVQAQLFVLAGSNTNVQTGTSGNDTLTGTGTVANWLAGGSGDDVLTANGAPSTMFGGAGNDFLYGGAANDALYGGPGVNSLFGNGGNDALTAGDDGNSLDGGDGNDTLTGGAGVDWLYGQIGADTLRAGAGTDALFGGDGNDTMSGEAGDDGLDGGLGDDTMSGGDGVDWLYGRGGNDTLSGDAGIDALFGEDGNDTLSGGADGDSLDGGFGDDVLDGGTGVDWLFGSFGNDTLNGGDDGDALFGQEGLDILHGGAGGDSLDGGADDDQIFGDDGVDWLFGQAGNDALDGGAGGDVLFGGDGIDTLKGGADGDSLDGGIGDDTLDGGAGVDVLWGDAGADTFLFSQITDGGDVVRDFISGTDFIGIDHVGFGLGFTGGLPANMFESGNGLPASFAAAGPVFYFDTTGHGLWFDPTGGSSADVKIVAGFETGTPKASDFKIL